MANPAQEARERLEAHFRKQYEADRTAEKHRAEREVQASRTVTQSQQKAVRLTRRAVGRAAGAECKPEGSRTRLVAQLLQELLTDGGVSLGPLEPMLPLSLMRPLETPPDPPEDALPALSFHSHTSAA
jgi:regulator of protease activity HflC (stomatin/prohibitin superfamily)